jgi:hypothetical protein
MPVLDTDERYITMFASTLHEDAKGYGFAFDTQHPTLNINPVTTGKLGLDYYFVTISNGGSTAPGSFLDAISTGNRWIILNTSVDVNTTNRNILANTVIDARGQRLTFQGKGLTFNAARPIMANVYFKNITGTNERGIDIRGGAIVGYFPNLRFRGDIADQGINAGAIGANGLNISMPNVMGTPRPAATGFNAFGNFGSSGEGSASAANNNDLMFVNLHHAYTVMGLRHPKFVGCYGHMMCPYTSWTGSDGIGVRGDVQNHIGELWVDHPTLHCTSTNNQQQNQGMYYQDSVGRGNIPNWNEGAQTGEVDKQGTTGTVSLQNEGSVTDPATYYSYSRHYATKNANLSAHYNFIQRRAGDREYVTVGGTLIGANGGDLVGRTLDLTFADVLSIDTLTTGEKTQLIDQEIVLPQGGSYMDARDLFDEADVSQPSARTIRLTVSKDASVSSAITDGYYHGGSGYVSGSSDDITSYLLSWNRILLNTGGSGGDIILSPPPVFFNYRGRFPAIFGLGL